MSTPSEQLAALEIEREGYVRRGLTERVAEVDKAIKALGRVKGPTRAKQPATEPASSSKPAPRLR